MAMTTETTDRQLAPDVAAKYARLRGIVRELGSVLVAWSAGVDSTLLLKVCHDELGDRAVAVTAVSESLPARELAAAKQLAAELGATVGDTVALAVRRLRQDRTGQPHRAGKNKGADPHAHHGIR